MPNATDIQMSMAGAWQVLLGRKEGFALLDLSEDGFWRSFGAIIVALPPMLLGWILLADTVIGHGGRVSTVARLATIDLADWLLPLLALTVVARPLGISRRFVHYVVASNWASAIFVWATLPGTLLRMVSEDAATIADVYAFILFVAAMVMFWRLTRVSLDRDAVTTTAIFLSLFTVSIGVLIVLQQLFGIDLPA